MLVRFVLDEIARFRSFTASLSKHSSRKPTASSRGVLQFKIKLGDACGTRGFKHS
ncbi:hypothetical protein ASPBRDRAFT_41788 [Aspergillus brasiliensis CBS 101740]|uniref:Uncharacterized protein n=1 Tax=Aspergillus brasiliensis (strain CBS 101740 / IMI 381727 / IBT 21946) TaxID=767769 RepID=A0A1L9UQR2_ASPBC|nr:hypothetical protein ASPBRDRAFT_41788 [Aspergillus brasiliensis CBS 101740]